MTTSRRFCDEGNICLQRHVQCVAHALVCFAHPGRLPAGFYRRLSIAFERGNLSGRNEGAVRASSSFGFVLASIDFQNPMLRSVECLF